MIDIILSLFYYSYLLLEWLQPLKYKPNHHIVAMLGGHKGTETQGGERTTNLQMSSQRRDTSPSNNGTNELIANLGEFPFIFNLL